MNKKNYLWIAIAVMVVAIAAVLLLMKDQKQGTEAENTPNKAVENTVPTTTPTIQALDAMPVAEEAILSVDGASMTPKTMKIKSSEKAFITFSAKDDARHTFNFIDDDLSFILVVFSKAEGDKSISFPVLKPGTYTYFVDDRENTGKLIVE